MPAWPKAFYGVRCASTTARSTSRAFERISVKCGSAGHVAIDLYNISTIAPTSSLIVHIPPLPWVPQSAPSIPKFMDGWPVASINYRWEGTDDTKTAVPSSYDPTGSLGWPTPVHDTAFAMTWLVDNLHPPDNGRRDIYVYGSHLGAGLAAALSLTGAHGHASFGIRGFAAYNGIYNWTMFLPDHRINRQAKAHSLHTTNLVRDSRLGLLQRQMPHLFGQPSNLFDPFASPNLFFQSPGLLVPETFYMSSAEATLIDVMANSEIDPTKTVKHPRKAHLVFPPRKSSLKIPETLLLHDSPPSSVPRRTQPKKRQPIKSQTNSFGSQAEEFAASMRRSIDMIELKERSKWDDDMERWNEEAHRRIQVLEVAHDDGSFDLGTLGQECAKRWLQDRM